MPQVFKLGSYWVYFWTNENNPVEPIHVHISEGKPVPHATKVWITKDGKCSLANNNSNKLHVKTKKTRKSKKIPKLKQNYSRFACFVTARKTTFFCRVIRKPRNF